MIADRVEAACRALWPRWDHEPPELQTLMRLGMVRALAAADALAPPPMTNRDYGGRLVREAWVRWALTQPDPKSSWLVPYEELSEPDKEADRQIAEALWSVRASPPVPEDVRLVERLTRERDEARAEVEALRRSEDEWASKTEVAQSYADMLIGAKNRLQARAETAEARLARAREALRTVITAYEDGVGMMEAIDTAAAALVDSEPADQEGCPL